MKIERTHIRNWRQLDKFFKKEKPIDWELDFIVTGGIFFHRLEQIVFKKKGDKK